MKWHCDREDSGRQPEHGDGWQAGDEDADVDADADADAGVDVDADADAVGDG